MPVTQLPTNWPVKPGPDWPPWCKQHFWEKQIIPRIINVNIDLMVWIGLGKFYLLIWCILLLFILQWKIFHGNNWSFHKLRGAFNCPIKPISVWAQSSKGISNTLQTFFWKFYKLIAWTKTPTYKWLKSGRKNWMKLINCMSSL